MSLLRKHGRWILAGVLGALALPAGAKAQTLPLGFIYLDYVPQSQIVELLVMFAVSEDEACEVVELAASARAVAELECENRGGHFPPGQPTQSQEDVLFASVQQELCPGENLVVFTFPTAAFEPPEDSICPPGHVTRMTKSQIIDTLVENTGTGERWEGPPAFDLTL